MAWYLSWLVASMAIAAAAAGVGALVPRAGRMAVRHAVWWVAAGSLCAALVASVPGGPASTAVPERAPSVSAGPAPGSVMPEPLVLPSLPSRVSLTAFAVWIAGVVAGLGRLGHDFVRLHRVRRACRPMSPSAARRFSRAFALSRTGRPVTFAWCDDIDRPAMIGLGPAILALPPAHAELLPDEETDRVLLHELAHARRYDDVAKVLERVLAALQLVNPVVHLVVARLDLTREMACDDWAVAHAGGPAAYVRTLASVARLGRETAPRWLPAAATGSRGALARRARRLLGRSYRAHAGAPPAVQAATAILAAGVAMGLLQLPPAFVEGVAGDVRAVADVARAAGSPLPATDAAPPIVTVNPDAAAPARGTAAGNRPAAPADARTRTPAVGAEPTAAGDAPPLNEFFTDAPVAEPPSSEAVTVLASTGLPVTLAAPRARAEAPGTLPAYRDRQPRWWSGVAGAAQSTAAAMTRLGTSISKPFTK
jgi:beta-lactamase regulating signal transducer with metallopeptidase domain